MKVITLQQPWAGLVVLGMKQYETRSWKTPYRGRIAIHASAKIPPEGLELIDLLKHNFISRFGPESKALELITMTGLVLGEVNLKDIFSTDSTPLPEDMWEREFGDYSPGRWFWKLEDRQIYERKVPAKGKLNIWSWTKPENVKPI